MCQVLASLTPQISSLMLWAAVRYRLPKLFVEGRNVDGWVCGYHGGGYFLLVAVMSLV
jgi:hypothetical protein